MTHLKFHLRPNESGTGIWRLNPDSEELFKKLWTDRSIPVARMREILDTTAGESALRRIARDMGLGRKAHYHGPPRQRNAKGQVIKRQYSTESLPKGMIEAWPANMGRFEDDPRPVRNKRI